MCVSVDKCLIQLLVFLTKMPRKHNLNHHRHSNHNHSGLLSSSSSSCSHPKDSAALHDRLHVPKSLQDAWNNDRCQVCTTHVNQLKQEAVAMVQSLEEMQQAPKDGASLNKLTSLMGSRDLVSLQRYLYTQHQQNGSASHDRRSASRQGGKSSTSAASSGNRLPVSTVPLPVAIQAQQYLEKTLGSGWRAHPKLNAALNQYQVSFYLIKKYSYLLHMLL